MGPLRVSVRTDPRKCRIKPVLKETCALELAQGSRLLGVPKPCLSTSHAAEMNRPRDASCTTAVAPLPLSQRE